MKKKREIKQSMELSKQYIGHPDKKKWMKTKNCILK